MSLQDPLSRVKGLGASGGGSHHWWLQRISALLLIPLTLWFLFNIVHYVGADYEQVKQWIARPYVAIFLTLYLGFMFFHAQLGLQVVVEDYVHSEGVKLILILWVKLVMYACAIVSIFSILKIAL